MLPAIACDCCYLRLPLPLYYLQLPPCPAFSCARGMQPVQRAWRQRGVSVWGARDLLEELGAVLEENENGGEECEAYDIKQPHLPKTIYNIM